MKAFGLVRHLAPCILLSLIASPAFADVFGFAADPDEFITSYEGFTWSGSSGGNSWVNGALDPLAGAPSAPLGYAWSNGGADLTTTSGSTFTFNSIALYGLNGTPTEPATIQGLLGGSVVDTFTTPALDNPLNTFTTFTLDWTGIDEITFSTNNESNLLLTDVTINEPVGSVPEPSALILFGSCLLGLGKKLLYNRCTRNA